MQLIIKNIIIVLKRFGVSCLLAVTGLAIAFAVFYMTAVQSYYDLRFDRNFEKANSIFLFSRVFPNSGVDFFSTNTIEPGVCAERYPEIRNYCYLRSGQFKFTLNDDNSVEERYFFENLTSASIGFIDMFKPRLLHGDIKQAFTQGYAMLTQSAAKSLFGEKYPIGEKIFYNNNTDELIAVTVAAVCADFPENCSLENGVYQFQPELDRRFSGFTTYFEIIPSDKDILQKKMNDDQYEPLIPLPMPSADKRIWQFKLTALPDVHFQFPPQGEKPVTVIILLMSVGLLLLVVSYINFLNFSVAMAPFRFKSITLRKILGENAFMLKLSMVIETVFFSFMAFLLSILFIFFLNTGALRDFFRADLAIAANPGLLFFIGIFSIMAGFLSGLYPAFYTTAFNPAMAISGSFFLSFHNKWLKNILIGLQFVAAIFLITTTLFINIQYYYMRNKDWGINTKDVLYLNVKPIYREVDAFMEELKRNANIAEITAGSRFPGQKTDMGFGEPFEGVSISLSGWYLKPNSFDFFGVHVTKGDRSM